MRYSLDNNENDISVTLCRRSPPHSPLAEATTRQMNSDNNRRPRSPLSAKSNVTPDAKRSKVVSVVSTILVHPEEVPVPSKRTLTALYKAALKQDEDCSDDTGSGDQIYLKPAGLLSLEEVLLPAIAMQEEKVLKKIQMKIQRDTPEYKGLLEQNRRLVRKAIFNATEAVQKSREVRCQKQQEQRERQAEKLRLEKEARMLALEEKCNQEAHERQKQRELYRQERRRIAKKQYPRNQELWKEVVFLTSSIAQLEKEERMWIQTEQQLIQQQSASTTSHSSEPEQRKDVIIAPKHPLQEEIEQSIQDIALASTRIQTGLCTVLRIMEDAEQVRKDMYEKYNKDHQFDGYQKVHDPKGMIRFLSQDD